MTKLDFLFYYNFGSTGYSFSGNPSLVESTRIDRMKNQLGKFANKHFLDNSSYIEVDFENVDEPSIKFFNLPLGLQDDVVDIIYNKSAI